MYLDEYLGKVVGAGDDGPEYGAQPADARHDQLCLLREPSTAGLRLHWGSRGYAQHLDSILVLLGQRIRVDIDIIRP